VVVGGTVMALIQKKFSQIPLHLSWSNSTYKYHKKPC